MGLSKKTFLYSVLLAGIMVTFIVGYFVFMLPSLYVNHVCRENIDCIVEVQQGYLENKTYDNLQLKNPSATYTAEIPKTGDTIYITSQFFKSTVRITDEELLEVLEKFRGAADNFGEAIESEVTEEEAAEFADYFAADKNSLVKKLFGSKAFSEEYPLDISIFPNESVTAYKGAYQKFHMMPGEIFVYELGISEAEGENGYITYLAMSETKDALVLSVLSAIKPGMNEILPVVLQSLPMIAAVVFLLVLVASRIFSGKIVNPVIRLAGYAESLQETDAVVEPFPVKGEDEIGVLAASINELYAGLQENYRKLEQKNQVLAEENKRQEVFLRASSHQLKTPIAAALLLVEGMINEVGKYKDTREHLPRVKKELLSMRKIVEDILYLNHCAENIENGRVSLREIAEEVSAAYGVQLADKKLTLSVEGNGAACTDREILKKIVDNLFSNAVQYTPAGERIEVRLADDRLEIINFGAAIEKELLPHIYDPFVSSDTKQKGKGLGLYVASYYGKVLGSRIEIENVENGVRSAILL